MKISESRLDNLLASSSPIKIADDTKVRAAVASVVDGFGVRQPRNRRVITASVVGGLLLVGSTAAALPSIFDGFGRIDYQSSQEYTVDGRGPVRCEFVFRVDPPVDGKVLEPSTGNAPLYDDVLHFVRTHDWAFDDERVALSSASDAPSGSQSADLGVMTDFISARWQAEVTSAYPNWLASVGEVNQAGQCVSVAGGSAP